MSDFPNREAGSAAPEKATRCRVCGSENWVPFVDRTPHLLFHCERCGYGAIDPLPTPEVLEEIYGADYFLEGGVGYPGYMEDEALHRRQARLNLRLLNRFARPERSDGEAARILDVGCAAGFFLAEAREAGWQVQGIELSEYARDYANQKLEIPVAAGGLLEGEIEDDSLDAISLFSVLAHLHDPALAIERAAAALRPGGVLLVETGNVGSGIARLQGSGWHGISPPSVVHYFTRRSLRELSARSGFEHLQTRPRFKLISKRHGFTLLRHKLGEPPRWFEWIDRTLPDGLTLAYGFGDIILATFRKQAD